MRYPFEGWADAKGDIKMNNGYDNRNNTNEYYYNAASGGSHTYIDGTYREVHKDGVYGGNNTAKTAGMKKGLAKPIAWLLVMGLAVGCAFGSGAAITSLVSSNSTSVESATTTAAETTAAPEEPVDPTIFEFRVTVSGATYLLDDNTETTADEIAELFTASDAKTLVKITDDSATQNAIEDLKKVLDEKNIPYEITSKE